METSALVERVLDLLAEIAARERVTVVEAVATVLMEADESGMEHRMRLAFEKLEQEAEQ